MMYIDENNATNIFQQLWQQCKSEEYCDVVLTADSGSLKIPAHRNILSATSDYFRVMFSSLKLESTQGEIKLPSFQHGILQSLIEFIYTGRIEIRTDNVIELLKTANMLVLKSVMIGCEKFLIMNLNASNCFGYVLIAEEYDFSGLLHAAKTYCYKNFIEASERDEFKTLNIDKLSEIVASDELRVATEKDVFNILMKWIQYDPTCREKYMGKLLNLVRLPLLEKSFLFHKVKPLCTSKECLKLYTEAIEWHLLPDRKVLRERKPTFLIAITLNEELNKMNFHYYCQKRLKWMSYRFSFKYRREFGFAVDKDMLYILGGQNKIDNELDTVTVVGLKGMCTIHFYYTLTTRGFGRCNAAFLNGILHAIFGETGYAEKWNQETEKWNSFEFMSEHRKNFGIVVLNNKLYVVGGTLDQNIITSSAECYDPQLNIWKSIKSMNVKRNLPGVAVASGLLYAVGGSNGEKTVERYDPQNDNWTMVCSLREPLYGIQSCTSHYNKVVVCYRNRIEEYDPETNKWIQTVLSNEIDSIYRLFSYSDKLSTSSFTCSGEPEPEPRHVGEVRFDIGYCDC